ncbi:hypothetical protein I552_6330 [Mycobacterium xenopi 3993]|nr:hypothetical protein I552_6330 [Mycobacterium xenopi 3993]
MAARIVIRAQVVVRQLVGRFGGGILGLGHAVPTHAGACTLSVDLSSRWCRFGAESTHR